MHGGPLSNHRPVGLDMAPAGFYRAIDVAFPTVCETEPHEDGRTQSANNSDQEIHGEPSAAKVANYLPRRDEVGCSTGLGGGSGSEFGFGFGFNLATGL